MLMNRNRTRILLLCLVVLALLSLAAVLLLNGHVRHAAAPYLRTPEEALTLEDMDCILVLGCGVRPDGTPSLMLQDRLQMGLRLYHDGAAPKLLMSGDHGRAEYDEVNAMKAFALESGVPSRDIFMDHAGFSTYESMYRARDVFLVKRLLIVSQGYHLYRAVYDACALGLDAYGVAAEDIAYGGQAGRELREILARNKDFFYCLIKPEPTFLGDSIPIGGNGDLTNG